MSIRNLLPSAWAGTLIAHVMPWFSNVPGMVGHRAGQNYTSNDPAVVSAQLDAMLAQGITAVNLDVRGVKFKEPIIDLTAREFFKQVPGKGMKACFCLDDKSNDSTTAMLAMLAGYEQPYFNNPAYLKDKNGKLVVLEFGLDQVDWNTVSARFPQCHFIHWKDDKLNGFAWLRASMGSAAIAQMVKENQEVYMPAVSIGFDDHNPKSPKQSIWGGPARLVPYASGQTLATICKSVQVGAEFVLVQTWNDIEEGTDVERNLRPNGLTPHDLGTVLAVSPAVPTAATIQASIRVVGTLASGAHTFSTTATGANGQVWLAQVTITVP